MNLIDRYIYAVARYLPESSREDVELELRANISDMLPENPGEEDIRRVLQELGNPMKLAAGYTQEKRYLIGPGYYDRYITVLKLVLGIVAAVITGVIVLSWIVTPVNEGDYVKVVTRYLIQLFSALLNSAVQAALWVTVVFVILERSGVGLDEYSGKRSNWTPDDLGEVPVPDKGRISRTGIVIGMFFTILITAVLYFQPELIFVFKSGKEGVNTMTPLLRRESLSFYMPFILVLAVFNLALLSWKYISGRWTWPLAIANAAHNAGFGILMIIMLGDRNLMSDGLITEISTIFSRSFADAQSDVYRFLSGITVIILLVCIWDSFDGFRLSFKSRRSPVRSA